MVCRNTWRTKGKYTNVLATTTFVLIFNTNLNLVTGNSYNDIDEDSDMFEDDSRGDFNEVMTDGEE